MVRAAAGGSVAARAALENPNDFPEALRYLHGWALELFGRDGFTEHGMNPLTWRTVDAWARLTQRSPEPYEIAALFELVGVLSARSEA